MQLRDDLESRNLLDATIYSFYKRVKNRPIENFLRTKDEEWGWLYTHFLVDRKYVLRYGYGQDRGFWVGGVELGIGPHYFGPAAFWSYEDSQRFSIDASTEGIIKNLALLDEFLAYRKNGVLAHSTRQ